MRTLLTLAAVLPLAVACSGRDALQAEHLLQEAQQAQAAVSSESFSAHLTVDAKGQKVAIRMTGGGYLKGDRAGDMVLDLALSAPSPLPFDSVEVAHVGGSTWMDVGGKRVTLPSGSFDGSGGNPLGAFDLTRYVKDVAVDGGQVLNGKPVTKITGVLDTASLVKGLATLGGAGTAAGVPDLNGKIGDTRVVIYVDDTTHLLVAALAELSVHGDGGDVSMHLDLAVTGVDQPVALPSA